MILLPAVDENARVDFFAGSIKSLETLKPVYKSLPIERQGTFYITQSLLDNEIRTEKINGRKIPSSNPLVICSYRDLHTIFYSVDDKVFIYIETEHTKDERGLLNTVSKFICINSLAYSFRKLQHKNVDLCRLSEASKKIIEFIQGKPATLFTEINGKSIGVIYMAFGNKAIEAVKKSIASLKYLGFKYPVAIVGDFQRSENWAEGVGCNIKWNHQTPFDISQRKNFQFRAGRVKPFLYDLSPFDYTLYLDADTYFMKPIHSGFELLNDYDLLVTEENLSLKQLYNKKLAGWEINLQERDKTIEEIGNEDQKFINSGVFFFRKSKEMSCLFEEWYFQWLRYQQWDEQLSFMRAIFKYPNLKVKKLPVEWNDPFPHDQSFIFHNYGRGNVRENYS